MKNILNVLCIFISISIFSQTKSVKKLAVKNVAKTTVKKGSTVTKPNPDLVVINKDLPLLIPKKKEDKFGYVNQNGKFIIQPEYHIAVFFYEDCNLLNSPNEKIRKFGTKNYATVEKDMISYRIDAKGKKVYQFKDSDLGKCKFGDYKQQLFQAYVLNGFYGIIEKSKFVNAADYRDYQIYPQYQYLYIMEGDDVADPMIVASQNDKFGVIDVNNKVIVPFEYSNIKRNFSWKLGKMFEVTKDGKEYYYIDANNKTY
ncbi:WG repeat-containing protein [Chryseobacterium sp. WG14]|uniref:WG repeat-containing protein n=1 Tax=unclassified Chryseobacterium TaxID=2593645 RepID=UPI001E5E53B8|nr:MULTISPECIES: WG repeat-containing protein [unclassified Chryseobacterium]MCQ9634627.1 WG repeat-containing protein [Chryseobacterium sp. WG23]MCQ9640603.1 WG repeat-containing protein [Chryseobacterium sp. WG14]